MDRQKADERSGETALAVAAWKAALPLLEKGGMQPDALLQIQSELKRLEPSGEKQQQPAEREEGAPFTSRD